MICRKPIPQGTLPNGSENIYGEYVKTTDELEKLKGLYTTLWKHKGLFQHSVSEVE